MPYKDKEKRLAYIKEWQDKNKEKTRQYKQNYKERNREKLREQYRQQRFDALHYYSEGKMECDCCGENHIEFLCIDHINGGGTAHRKSIPHNDFYRYLKQENYPDGYRVLCHNCNASHGYYGYCPHQKERLDEDCKEHIESGD